MIALASATAAPYQAVVRVCMHMGIASLVSIAVWPHTPSRIEAWGDVLLVHVLQTHARPNRYATGTVLRFEQHARADTMIDYRSCWAVILRTSFARLPRYSKGCRSNTST